MITCKEVARSIAGDDLEGAGPWHRLRVRLHLLMCRHCRRYAEQMRSLGAAARALFRTAEESGEDLERLERSILARLDETAPDPGGEEL